MGIDRRRFLKIAGLTVVGAGAAPWLRVLTTSGTAHVAQDSEATSIKKWAMVIDLEKCAQQENCTDCFEACHVVHNVPKVRDPEEEIKWIWQVEFHEAFPDQEHEYTKKALHGKPAIVLCNHCDDPPCTKVCPTKATWRREDGIVMMDYHRCIGCRYCMAACPYGARSFNWQDPRPFIKEVTLDFPTRSKGVVEKCNFCVERLAKGLQPACVEACKEKALVFGDLEDPDSEVRKLLRDQYAIRRKPNLGSNPKVYYTV